MVTRSGPARFWRPFLTTPCGLPHRGDELPSPAIRTMVGSRRVLQIPVMASPLSTSPTSLNASTGPTPPEGAPVAEQASGWPSPATSPQFNEGSSWSVTRTTVVPALHSVCLPVLNRAWSRRLLEGEAASAIRRGRAKATYRFRAYLEPRNL